MDKLIFISVLFLSLSLNAQESIEGGFEFLTDDNKKYSIYVPSSYDESESNALMVGSVLKHFIK